MDQFDDVKLEQSDLRVRQEMYQQQKTILERRWIEEDVEAARIEAEVRANNLQSSTLGPEDFPTQREMEISAQQQAIKFEFRRQELENLERRFLR